MRRVLRVLAILTSISMLSVSILYFSYASADTSTHSGNYVVYSTDSLSDITISGNLYVVYGATCDLSGTVNVHGSVYVWGTLNIRGTFNVSNTLYCLHYGSMLSAGDYDCGYVNNLGAQIKTGSMNVTASWLSTTIPGANPTTAVTPSPTPAPTSTATGNNWSFDNGVLTITGNTPDYSFGKAPWYSLANSITRVIVKPGVTKLGQCSFYGLSKLQSVALPDTLTSIGIWAFMNCSSLREIVLPYGLTKIDQWAFNGCSGLNTITIPSTITSLGALGIFNDEVSNVQAIIYYNNTYAINYCSSNGIAYSLSCADTHKRTHTVEQDRINPTCEEDGGYRIVNKCRICNSEIENAWIPLPALGHDWNSTNYLWSDDNSTVTASRVCNRDSSHIETEIANAQSSITTAETCTTNGTTTYSASFRNSAFASQTKQLDNIPALGHDWNPATYVWNDTNSIVTASRICNRDNTHVETEHATVDKTISIPATCTAMGETTYVASFQNDAFVAQTKSLVDIPALGHDWNTIVYEWSNDNSIVTATRVCKRDANHVEIGTASTTREICQSPSFSQKGKELFTTLPFENAAFQVQSKTVSTIPALKDLNVLYLPDSVSTVDNEAFTGTACDAIIVPDSCQYIGSKAFSDCPNLVYIKIPPNVEFIADNAFEDSSLIWIDQLD